MGIMKWIKWLSPSREEIMFEMQNTLFKNFQDQQQKKRQLDQFLLEVLTKGWRNVEK